MKQANRKPNKRFLDALIVLFAAGLLFCAAMLVKPLLEYRAGDNAYHALDAYAPASASPEASVAPASGASIGKPAPEYANMPDFAALRAINPDIAGWLECPGTVLNYPVVQGTDNSYYLKHLFNRDTNAYGAPFVDCANAPGFTDENTIIYGHHMKNGSMFASLVNYKQQAYYDAHPVLYLSTPDGVYRVELFAGYVTSGRADNPVYTRNFGDKALFLHFLMDAKAKSDFAADVRVTAEDRILTLSTCTYEYDEARYVVLGKLVKIS